MRASRSHPSPRRAARRRASNAAGALLLLMAGACVVGFSSATSEFEFADPSQAPSAEAHRSSSSNQDPPPGPAELIHSSVDETTGLRTDTFIKPLGRLTPGKVMNTR